MHQPNDVIERYRLVSLLGSGGMGEVWLAEEGDSGLQVALKLPTDPDYISQLRREGKLQLALDHPNIVKVHRLAIEHEPPFVAMEYVEGKSLRAVMREKGALSLEQAVRFTTHILNGLAAAHRRGVVHRDIKPENILIGGDGRAKITDFGLGKVVQDLSISLLMSGSMLSSAGGSIAGTYDYMSPEQRAGKEIGPQADVYAAGLIMFELLTGARASGSLRRILYRRNIPEPLIALILKAADMAENRFVDATDFLRALKAALEQPACNDAPQQIAAKVSFDIAGPASSPTPSPTTSPTSSPTTSPTSSPTFSSTTSPTSSPSPETIESHSVEGRPASVSATTDITDVELPSAHAPDESARQTPLSSEPADVHAVDAEAAQAGESSSRKKPASKSNWIPAAAAMAGAIAIVYWIVTILNSDAGNKTLASAANPEAASPAISDEKIVEVPSVQAPEPEKAPGKTFVDLGGGVTLALIAIKGGTFQMGSPGSESERSYNEGPVHAVELDSFWMGETEVTQAQYEAITGENPSSFKDASNPVDSVSWDDAMEYCRKLSAKTGRSFTLPTEAQWEYACRADSTDKYSFGNSDSELGDYAWFGGASQFRTHPVAQKKPNAWGLYDIHGNVWEWCADYYDADYYAQSLGRNPAGPASGKCHVMRGGSWLNGPGICRSAFRYWYEPDFSGYVCGFRVVFAADGFKPIEGRAPNLSAKRGDGQEPEATSARRPLNKDASTTVVKRSSDGRYAVSSESVISDPQIDLQWLVGPDWDTDFKAAEQWIIGINENKIAGGNWRMPTRAELQTLFQKGKGERNMDSIFETTGWWVWAAQGDSSPVWNFNFRNGNERSSKGMRATSCRVFAVRSGR